MSNQDLHLHEKILLIHAKINTKVQIYSPEKHDHIFHDTWLKVLTHDACNKFFITIFSNCFSFSFTTLSISSTFPNFFLINIQKKDKQFLICKIQIRKIFSELYFFLCINAISEWAISLAFSSLSKLNSDSIFNNEKKNNVNIYQSYIT